MRERGRYTCALCATFHTSAVKGAKPISQNPFRTSRWENRFLYFDPRGRVRMLKVAKQIRVNPVSGGTIAKPISDIVEHGG